MPMFLRKLLGKNEAQGEAGQKSTQAPHGMQTMQPMLQRKFAKGVQYNMKIVIRGDRNVGKSCLFYRLQGQKFKEEYLPTEEIQVASIQWNYKATDDVVKVEVWDVVDKGKKKKKIDGLKLENENMGTTDPWGGSGTHSETSDRLPEDPCLDAEFIDVYKGTHGVIMMMDITKQWTFSYIERELPKVPSNIPVLVLANHRDMGHHRTVNEDTVRYFIENLERPEGAAEVKYAEASMRNGFGLKYLHKFFNLPFLQLQRETLLRQLETNKRDIESTIEELGIHEESEEQNYELFMEALANKRREQQEKLSEASRSEAASPAVSNGPTSGVAAPAREAPPAHPIPGLSVTPATPASPEQASPQAATTNSNPVSPATSDQADRSTESTPAAEEPGERKGFITRFFRKAKEPKPVIPVEEYDLDEERAAIEKELQGLAQCDPRKRKKRGEYNSYTDEQRCKIARYAHEHGNTKASRHFSRILGRNVSDGTVRSFKKKYLEAMEITGSDSVEVLPNNKRGRPPLLGDLDGRVMDAIRQIHANGGVVNRLVAIGTATAIVRHRKPHLLKENGGHLELTQHWAESLMARMGYISPGKGGKSKQAPLVDNTENKRIFLATIAGMITARAIPGELIVNFNQIGVNIVPSNEWAHAVEGKKDVRVTGLDDKRQITVVLGCSLNGNLLPLQVLYQGKTDACHANFSFPTNWDIYHSPTQWSNIETLERYAKNVLIPYVQRTKARLGLAANQWAIAIFDSFQAYQMQPFINLLHAHYIHSITIPPGCSKELQPLELSGNKPFKEFLKARFSAWYADSVMNQLRLDPDGNPYTVDLSLYAIKPLHAAWLVEAWEDLRCSHNYLTKGWADAGILKAYTDSMNVTLAKPVDTSESVSQAMEEDTATHRPSVELESPVQRSHYQPEATVSTATEVATTAQPTAGLSTSQSLPSVTTCNVTVQNVSYTPLSMIGGQVLNPIVVPHGHMPVSSPGHMPGISHAPVTSMSPSDLMVLAQHAQHQQEVQSHHVPPP